MRELLPTVAWDYLTSILSRERLLHSEGVAETAFHLADSWKQYSVDRVHLAWASLFHDCGKEISKKKISKILQDGPIPFGQELLDSPKLIHAPLGAKLVEKKFGIDVPDILAAIAYHPTGHPDLKPLGWMIYLADYLEPGRTFFPERKAYFDAACLDPLTGLRLVTELRFRTVLQKGREIHPLAIRFKEHLDTL